MKLNLLCLFLLLSASILGQHEIDSLNFEAFYDRNSSIVSSVEITFLVDDVNNINNVYTYVSGANLKKSTTFNLLNTDYNCGSIFFTSGKCNARQKVKLIISIDADKPIEEISYLRIYVTFKDRIYSNELVYEK